MTKRDARDSRGSAAWVLVLLTVGVMQGGQAAAAEQQAAAAPFVAGLEPDRRPDVVPVPAEFRRDSAWRARALKGVSEPIPPSLKFVDDQGGWYNPFLDPGMPGRYDIRGRHSPRTTK